MTHTEAHAMAYWQASRGLRRGVSRETVLAVFRSLSKCDCPRLRRLAFNAIKKHSRADLS